ALGRVPTLRNGAPAPEVTGVPTVDGIPLWPPQDFYCNISVTFDDVELPQVGCVKKYMRMWTIQEWWCNTDLERQCPQLIEIVDTLPPSFDCPPDIKTTTKGGYVCEADVFLPPIDAEDICNNDIRIDVRYPGGFLKDMNGGLVHLPVGVHTVTYIVYDGCYNVDSCDITVEVEDLTPPVAVCDRYTVVGLTYDSVAHVYAETFDDGSYDDCFIDSFSVKRMDDGRGCGVFQPNFKRYVEFCCDDIGQNVMVIFRVVDKAGNVNDCMVEVEVQDKILPHIYCPPNLTVSCDFHYDPNDLSASFGKVVTDKKLREPIVLNDPNASWDGELIDGHAYDNCSVTVTTDSVFDITQCNVGTITRTFTATDPNGSVRCTQTITFENFHPFDGRTDIIWPLDFDTIGCIDPATLTEDVTGRPVFIEDECDLVGYSFEDHIFPFFNTIGNQGACLKIIRKWKVIDWCDFRFDPRTGQYEYTKYTHEQIIKVNDDVDPEFDFVTPDRMFCSFDTTCTNGPATLIAEASDNCTPGDELRWEYHIDAFNDGIYEISEVGKGATIDASDDYPLGDHRIKYVFEDRCGNKIATERLFSIVNCKLPTPYCKNGIVVDLMPMDTNRDGTVDIGMVEIWANDLDLGSFGPCGNPIVLSFSQDTNDRSRVYDCDSLPQVDVNIWVTDRITGNQNFCRTFIILQDNNNACGPDSLRGSVSGFIVTEDDQKVRDAQIDLQGSGFGSVMTQQNGQYAFPAMPFGGSYEVQPAKNDDHMNGISTRDLIFIQRHLLGKEELNTPYKRIAADVNADANISVNDIVELRRLILGAYEELPNNTSWKFVDQGYIFPDPKDPFNPMYPEKYVIDHFVNDMPNVDFVAVKVGDVDNSVDAGGLNNNQTREDASMILTTQDQEIGGGREIAVNITSGMFTNIVGSQFTLNFDPEALDFAEVTSGLIELGEQNIGLNYLNEGIINISWNNVNGLSAAEGEVLFTLHFVGLRSDELSNVLSINSRMVEAEAYTGIDEILPVQLGFSGSNGESVSFRLYQNHPNPFNNATVIGFDLPEDGDVQLTVYDVTGKVVALYQLAGKKGYNSTEIFSSELTSTGVLYYQLDSKGYTATKKMVVLQ
ncbi:MAG: HYR domain-containing protein, partial [Saprospiraceae bacterium]|nr:HYR domain-containing protein [Saprospiraceae bacterium]